MLRLSLAPLALCLLTPVAALTTSTLAAEACDAVELLQRRAIATKRAIGSVLFPVGNRSRAALLQQATPPAECLADHSEDTSRPIAEVLAEHPGEDGWCHFGFMGDWAYACAESHVAKDYTVYSTSVGYSILISRELPYAEIAYDGGRFYSRNRFYAFDDMYCHANGWLQGMGLDLSQRTNYTRWAELSDSECRKHSGLVEASVSMDDMHVRSTAIADRLRLHMDGLGPAPTRAELQRHAAMKCAVGDVGCDMAYCMNWCLRADGHVGYNAGECEQ